MSIVAYPSLGPLSFPSLTLRIHSVKSRSSSTLANPGQNLMFFVRRNTLQSFQTFEKLSAAKIILCLVPFRITNKTCLKSPPNTINLPLIFTQRVYCWDNEWHRANSCLWLQNNACESLELHPKL